MAVASSSFRVSIALVYLPTRDQAGTVFTDRSYPAATLPYVSRLKLLARKEFVLAQGCTARAMLNVICEYKGANLAGDPILGWLASPPYSARLAT